MLLLMFYTDQLLLIQIIKVGDVDITPQTVPLSPLDASLIPI